MSDQSDTEDTVGTLTIVTTQAAATTSIRRGDPGAPSKVQEARRMVEATVGLDTLRANFDRFLGSLQAIVDVKQAQAGDFVLDEITFSAEISANGEFKLFGSGVGVTATNAVTFTLRRKEREQ